MPVRDDARDYAVLWRLLYFLLTWLVGWLLRAAEAYMKSALGDKPPPPDKR